MKEKKQQQEDDNQFNMNLLYAPELEKAVLGTLMTDKKAYALISDILRPESFYEYRHQLIYAAIITPRGQSNADRYSNCKGAT